MATAIPRHTQNPPLLNSCESSIYSKQHFDALSKDGYSEGIRITVENSIFWKDSEAMVEALNLVGVGGGVGGAKQKLESESEAIENFATPQPWF